MRFLLLKVRSLLELVEPRVRSLTGSVLLCCHRISFVIRKSFVYQNFDHACQHCWREKFNLLVGVRGLIIQKSQAVQFLGKQYCAKNNFSALPSSWNLMKEILKMLIDLNRSYIYYLHHAENPKNLVQFIVKPKNFPPNLYKLFS